MSSDKLSIGRKKTKSFETLEDETDLQTALERKGDKYILKVYFEESPPYAINLRSLGNSGNRTVQVILDKAPEGMAKGFSSLSPRLM